MMPTPTNTPNVEMQSRADRVAVIVAARLDGTSVIALGDVRELLGLGCNSAIGKTPIALLRGACEINENTVRETLSTRTLRFTRPPNGSPEVALEARWMSGPIGGALVIVERDVERDVERETDLHDALELNRSALEAWEHDAIRREPTASMARDLHGVLTATLEKTNQVLDTFSIRPRVFGQLKAIHTLLEHGTTLAREVVEHSSSLDPATLPVPAGEA